MIPAGFSNSAAQTACGILIANELCSGSADARLVASKTGVPSPQSCALTIGWPDEIMRGPEHFWPPCREPVWSPDGREVLFMPRRRGKSGLYRKVVGGAGAETLLFESDES